MRLQVLDLLAYGPFTEQRLDFSATEPALHVVFGPNEAGKSTALRAITGLLFGIEERTTDDHLHRKSALRIGGQIVWGEGQELRMVRRKGRKGTLLDEHGDVLDEALLARAMGGVSRQLFITMFGLDHRTLRAGAHALLSGGGEVGESLFDAGGARGVHQLLQRLRGEADELYRPRGSKQKLAQALRAYQEARKAIDIAETLPAGYVAQEQHLEECKAERDGLVAKRQQLAAERHQLERMRAVLPHVARLRELRSRVAGLGEVPIWLADMRPEREAATRQRQVAARDVERLVAEQRRLTEQLAQIEVNDALVAIERVRIAEVQDALGNHRQAAQHLPKRQGQLAELEQDARLILRRLGAGHTLETVEALRLDAAAEARIDSLVLEHPRLIAELSAAERALAVGQRRAAELADRRDALPPLRPTASLRSALRRAERETGLEAQLAAAQRDVAKLQEALAQSMRALLPFSAGHTAAELVAWLLPPSTALDDFEHERAAAQQAQERLSERRRVWTRERERVVLALDALEQAGAVPSVEQLQQVRAERDARWQTLLASVASGEPPAPDAYLIARARADTLADQLWQQADRVAQAARLRAEQAAHERTGAVIEQDEAQLAVARADQEQRWQQLWQPALADPGAPAQMAAWLERHAALREQWARCEEARRQIAAMTAELARHREQLLAAWRMLDEPANVAELSFGELLDVASQALEHYQQVARRHEALDGAVAQNARELHELEVARDSCGAAMASWRRKWAAEVATLALPEDASVQEVTAVRARLRELFNKLKEARNMQQRIDGIERDATHFSQQVAALLQQTLPLAQSLAPAEGAAALVAAYQQAVAAQAEWQRLSREHARKEAELAAARGRFAEAQGQLDALLQRAAVEDLQALEILEQRAVERKQLDEQLDQVAAVLLKMGDGRTVAELSELAADSDVDQASARLAAVTEELEQLGERIDRLNVEIGNQEYGLEQHFHQRKGAYAAAMDKQTCLAEVRRHAERYAKLRLAILIMEQEIERYRQLNQGPILSNASEMFRTLTLQRYAELRVDYAGGDEPELRCLRADGTQVAVDGLSDGTRDQLYLALRLASLERYAQRAEMMPFVLDDILVHFDDDRARAALRVLADLTRITQVLFFTHHNRLLELAHEVIAPEQLREHRLPGRVTAS